MLSPSGDEQNQRRGARAVLPSVPGGMIDVLIIHKGHRTANLTQPHKPAEPAPHHQSPVGSAQTLQKIFEIKGNTNEIEFSKRLHFFPRSDGKMNINVKFIPAVFAKELLELGKRHVPRHVLHVQRRVGRRAIATGHSGSRSYYCYYYFIVLIPFSSVLFPKFARCFIISQILNGLLPLREWFCGR